MLSNQGDTKKVVFFEPSSQHDRQLQAEKRTEGPRHRPTADRESVQSLVCLSKEHKGLLSILSQCSATSVRTFILSFPYLSPVPSLRSRDQSLGKCSPDSLTLPFFSQHLTLLSS